MDMRIVPAYTHHEEVSELFSEYTDMLIANEESFKDYLVLQNYEEEVSHLEDKYGMPDGRLYLLYCDDKLAGCIGLRKIDAKNCEMKRLYIRPEFRGRKLGKLQSAIHLYRKFGFYETGCYNDSPVHTSIFMKLDL